MALVCVCVWCVHEHACVCVRRMQRARVHEQIKAQDQSFWAGQVGQGPARVSPEDVPSDACQPAQLEQQSWLHSLRSQEQPRDGVSKAMEDLREPREADETTDAQSDLALQSETRGKWKGGRLYICLSLSTNPGLIFLSLEPCHLEATARGWEYQIEQLKGVSGRTYGANACPTE